MSIAKRIAAASIGLVLVVALGWIVMPKKSHEIVIKPAVTVQR